MKSWPRIDGALADYVDANWLRESPLKRRLRERTGKMRQAGMQISAHQGQQMALLARIMGAKRAVEVGTFTGYSALCVAEALGPDGKLWCCDVSEEWTAIARRYFREAGVERKIDLRIAAALDTLRSMPAGNLFDFAFVDGDKKEYSDYYEEILKRLRPGGLLTIDNVLWGGRVADPSDQSESTLAIRRLNDRISRDERVDAVMVPIADGLAIVRKR